jgi:hypothetical protein
VKTKISVTLLALLALAFPNISPAQFTGNNQTNIISDITRVG